MLATVQVDGLRSLAAAMFLPWLRWLLEFIVPLPSSLHHSLIPTPTRPLSALSVPPLQSCRSITTHNKLQSGSPRSYLLNLWTLLTHHSQSKVKFACIQRSKDQGLTVSFRWTQTDIYRRSKFVNEDAQPPF